jgi:hypothetical protein
MICRGDNSYIVNISKQLSFEYCIFMINRYRVNFDFCLLTDSKK